MQKLPNLVIAGPPKCGTSSLYQWLSDHPAVCASRPKETFYLMDKGHPLLPPGAHVHESGIGEYERFFDHCPNEVQVRFEATTHYVYQRTAREVLAHLPTEPLVLFVLRNPSRRVRSSFRFTQNNLANVSEELSFERYVEAVLNEDFESIAQYFYDAGSAYVLERDVWYSRYAEHLARWRAHLGRRRMLVLLFEDMKKAPRSFMKRVARRVGVEPSFYDGYDFAVENKSYHLRSQWLHRLARSANKYLAGGWLKNVAKRGYLSMQKRKRKDGRSDEQAIQRLERHFAPHNRRLAKEFGLDLAAWNRQSESIEP